MMRSVHIQFHMLLDELIDFAATVSKQYSLPVELERFPDAARRVPAGADLVVAMRDLGRVDRIWLLYKSQQSSKTERFMLNVGVIRENRLGQAGLSAGTDSMEAYEVLKKVAAELRRRTVPGVWVVGETGIASFTKLFRVSPGAAKASRAGEVELKNISLTQLIRVDPPA